jgi:hypothetical protein
MANVIKALGKPTLIISHNKTLAAQLYGEMKAFFPENAVEYFVSYYDYYQPEAYVPSSDTYIAKDSSVNDEIDKLRHSATAALIERKDVIVVASVACIYAGSNPEDYKEMFFSLKVGEIIDRQDLIKRLVVMQYQRNDMDALRGTFSVKGDVIEVRPGHTDKFVIRIEMFDDEIERITEVDPLTKNVLNGYTVYSFFPASGYARNRDDLLIACDNIEKELADVDIVVGSVLIPGDITPHLITADMLKKMERGTVLVDVAIDQGGCFETSRPTTHSEPVYEIDGIIHYAVANIPGAVPNTSTMALTNATLKYALALADKGWQQACREDPALYRGLNIVEGKVTFKAVADAFGLLFDPVVL